MKKPINPERKNLIKIILSGIIGAILIAGVPIGIIWAFHSDKGWITTSLQEKDILSYYTSLLGLSLTITTFVLAYRHATDRIVHSQEYNRLIEEFQTVEKRVDECFETIHPVKLKQYRLITKDDNQYVYMLSSNLENYKYSVTVAIETAVCKLKEVKQSFEKELFNDEDFDGFVEQLEKLEKECNNLTDSHLKFYSNYIFSKKTDSSDDDFLRAMTKFDNEIDDLCEKFRSVLTLKERVFNLIFSKIALSSPSNTLKTKVK